MFNEATHSLPATNTDTYTLVAWRVGMGRFARLYSFRSYDLALAAYEAAVEYHVSQGVDKNLAYGMFAVRSMDDPMVEALGGSASRSVPFAVVAGAVRGYVRKEQDATARTFLRTATDADSFDGLVAKCVKSLRDRGFNTERWEMQDSLKKYATIGRCHVHGNKRAGYFFARTGGVRLSDVRCPECGAHLQQTTLALDTRFAFISNPVATYFDKSLDRLPRETDADVDSRLDRFHLAVEEGF